jgi:prophage regulatory protein
MFSPGKQQPARARIVRERECQLITGLSRSQRYRQELEGRFPKRIQLGPRCSGWLESELEAWIHAQASRRAAA